MIRRWSAPSLIDLIVDADSFSRWDEELTSTDPLGFVDTRSYVSRLVTAAEATDVTEAVLTGAARVGGRDVVVIAGAFEFLAGTQGLVAGERVARAFDRATHHRLAVVGLPTSGGTRMQEGSLAFVQMLKIAASIAAFRAAGGRYVAWLRHPTMGGVLASYGSLAHVTWAQPGALVGLTGPRVIAEVDGTPLPEHVQRAEHLVRHGVVDDVVPADALRQRIGPALAALDGPAHGHGHEGGPWSRAWPAHPVPATLPPSGQRADDPWAAVVRSRAAGRPGLPALLDLAATDVVRLRGDGAGGRDDGCVTVVCRFRDRRVVVVGHDRPAGARGAAVGAVGYRAAHRAMRLADTLGLPLVTVVDTRGAASTSAAESGGIAREIATCMATMSTLRRPTVAVLLGEGSGGGAIAWLPADRVVAVEHAWLAPIAPEGASAILYRTSERAAELARTQAIDVWSLRAIGVVDQIVPEAADWLAALADAVADQLTALLAQPTDTRLTARAQRLRSIGSLTTRARERAG